MEVGVEVFAESFTKGTKIHSNTAYLTFVGVDEKGNPVKTVNVKPETDEELSHYEEALKRREYRLKNRKKL